MYKPILVELSPALIASSPVEIIVTRNAMEITPITAAIIFNNF